jgi:hypothetical protein
MNLVENECNMFTFLRIKVLIMPFAFVSVMTDVKQHMMSEIFFLFQWRRKKRVWVSLPWST